MAGSSDLLIFQQEATFYPLVASILIVLHFLAFICSAECSKERKNTLFGFKIVDKIL